MKSCPNEPCRDCPEACPNRRGGRWNRAEENLVKASPHETDVQIGFRINRSASAVAAKRRSLSRI